MIPSPHCSSLLEAGVTSRRSQRVAGRSWLPLAIRSLVIVLTPSLALLKPDVESTERRVVALRWRLDDVGFAAVAVAAIDQLVEWCG